MVIKSCYKRGNNSPIWIYMEGCYEVNVVRKRWYGMRIRSILHVSPISQVLFWYSEITQNTTHTKKNITMFTNNRGWCNPIRQVSSDSEDVELKDSDSGNVRGSDFSIGHSYTTWKPRYSIGDATKCKRHALKRFCRPKNGMITESDIMTKNAPFKRRNNLLA